VHLDGDLLTMPTGLRLDLGATAKAFTADRIAADVADRLGTGVLVNLGGDIATEGPAPSGGWQITVQDLPEDPAGQVALRAGWALATSSTQRRTWVVEGERRHHIIDPMSGRPAAPVWRTVSVAAPSALTANTYSTAAVVLGEEAVAELSAIGLPARAVTAQGRVITLNGWPEDALPAAGRDE
jgi:thiamine biosynthesis lipoprotein